MENFTPVTALIGGVMIGASAAAMMLLNGRIAGISGIIGGLMQRQPMSEIGERLAFLGGLLLAGVLLVAFAPQLVVMDLPRSGGALVAAGLLVGVGTRMGNGCTSGHGVCGISRRSPRSLTATVTFIATGMVMAFVVTQLFGGRI